MVAGPGIKEPSKQTGRRPVCLLSRIVDMAVFAILRRLALILDQLPQMVDQLAEGFTDFVLGLQLLADDLHGVYPRRFRLGPENNHAAVL